MELKQAPSAVKRAPSVVKRAPSIVKQALPIVKQALPEVKRTPPARPKTRKARRHVGKWVDIDMYRSEFDRNGPLMNIILEYLLVPAAAVAYAIQFPEARILERLAGRCSPTVAACYAVQTHNWENALVMLDCHKGDVTWEHVFATAVALGNAQIAARIFPLCSAFGSLRSARSNARRPGLARLWDFLVQATERGNIPMIRQLLSWRQCEEEDVETILRYARHVPTVKLALELGATSIGDKFVVAASRGQHGILRMLGGLSSRAAPSGKQYHFTRGKLRRALSAAAAHGSVRAVRYIMTLDGITTDDLSPLFGVAVDNGQLAMCKFLLGPKNREFISARDIQNGVLNAARRDSCAILRFLWSPDHGFSWSARFANQVLRGATTSSAARILLDGVPGLPAATDVNKMLLKAAQDEYPDLQRRLFILAKERGATAFPEALEHLDNLNLEGIQYLDPKECTYWKSNIALLKKWIAE